MKFKQVNNWSNKALSKEFRRLTEQNKEFKTLLESYKSDNGSLNTLEKNYDLIKEVISKVIDNEEQLNLLVEGLSKNSDALHNKLEQLSTTNVDEELEFIKDSILNLQKDNERVISAVSYVLNSNKTNNYEILNKKFDEFVSKNTIEPTEQRIDELDSKYDAEVTDLHNKLNKIVQLTTNFKNTEHDSEAITELKEILREFMVAEEEELANINLKLNNATESKGMSQILNEHEDIFSELINSIEKLSMDVSALKSANAKLIQDNSALKTTIDDFRFTTANLQNLATKSGVDTETHQTNSRSLFNRLKNMDVH